MKEARAGDRALCCFGLLCRPQGLDAILNVLPETRRRELQELLKELAGPPRSEIAEELKALRQADVAGAIRRSGASPELMWEALPRPVQRWVCARGQESDGR
jgi:hypothetical protein